MGGNIKGKQKEIGMGRKAELNVKANQEMYSVFAAEDYKTKEGIEQSHRRVPTMKARGNLKDFQSLEVRLLQH